MAPKMWKFRHLPLYGKGPRVNHKLALVFTRHVNKLFLFFTLWSSLFLNLSFPLAWLLSFHLKTASPLPGKSYETSGNGKLALVGIIPGQILLSFSTNKDRRTERRIRRQNTAQPSQDRERATRIHKNLGSILGGAARCGPFLCRS